MTPQLILGPILRYTGPQDATIWVETDAACEVEVRIKDSSHRSQTFHVEGHHYALVHVEDLKPGNSYEYEVALAGEQAWPEPNSGMPSVIRTLDVEATFRLAFGSCRVAVPHRPPYTLNGEESSKGYDVDALHALALRMRQQPPEEWPDALLLLGDQIYADEVSVGTLEFIRSRRDTSQPPGEEVADFQEYTHLYLDSWGEPSIRWLLSTVPTAMIFDDHDVNDDWNISAAWIEKMRAKPWWDQRITSGLMSYWIYQHLGNLSPEDLSKNELLARVKEADDAGPLLREFARRADRDPEEVRWSFHRDFGETRLVVVDSRAGRMLKEGQRLMVDEQEWDWVERHATGGFDHLLIGTSLPLILAPGIHHFEAWNEAVCAGAWGARAAQVGELIRQTVDLEQWPAFHKSFNRFAGLLRSIAAGERGDPPASIAVLSGDVHHTYLAQLELRDPDARSPVYQATCSPFRNPLPRVLRHIFRAGWSEKGTLAGRLLSRSAGLEEPEIGWHLTHDGPWFDNHVATLELEGRRSVLKIEKATSRDGDSEDPILRKIFEYHLSREDTSAVAAPEGAP
ncbi:MAG: alkaline phosphatase family protein [Actinomycetota bacterium]|nr:alkaline phosphatase family protein [Actinomycetota bacterium]